MPGLWIHGKRPREKESGVEEGKSIERTDLHGIGPP